MNQITKMLIILSLMTTISCQQYDAVHITGRYYIMDQSELTTGIYYLAYEYGNSGFAAISPMGVQQYYFEKDFIFLKYNDDNDTSNSTYYYVKICYECEVPKATYLYGPFKQFEFDEKLEDFGKFDIKFQNIEMN
jgi:hypothetical protein